VLGRPEHVFHVPGNSSMLRGWFLADVVWLGAESFTRISNRCEIFLDLAFPLFQLLQL